MPLTYDERVELLKKARQAKADKKLVKAKEIEIVKEPENKVEDETPPEKKKPVKKTVKKEIVPKKNTYNSASTADA